MKNSKKILIALYLTLFCLIYAYGQDHKIQDKPKEPALIPLTEDEKKIIPKDILSNQPDFAATQTYFSAREISGFSAASKVARKGNKYRTDTGFVVAIAEPRKPTLILNQNKTYEESVGIRRPYVSATVPLNPTDLLEFEDLSLNSLGTIEVDGNKLLKIQAKSKEFDKEVLLYADLGKRNLITIIQILSPQRNSIQRLQEISFAVPTELFDMSAYRALPKYTWRKIQNAQILYEGKHVKDGVAFQHDKYIFIHAGEFDHLLVDLEKKIANPNVFRGLLLASDGSHIWTTTESEALSTGELDGYIGSDCDKCVTIKSDSNSLTIPDPHGKAKILVKVTW